MLPFCFLRNVNKHFAVLVKISRFEFYLKKKIIEKIIKRDTKII